MPEMGALPGFTPEKVVVEVLGSESGGSGDKPGRPWPVDVLGAWPKPGGVQPGLVNGLVLDWV
jgi:hypothetical protein